MSEEGQSLGFADGVARIDVGAEQPYPVLIGRGVRGRLATTVADLGAARALVVHQPALADAAEAAREHLDAAGVDAHRVEVPDAEEGKSLAVAGFCWEVCGQAGLTRSDVVVGFGGGAATAPGRVGAAPRMPGVRLVPPPAPPLPTADPPRRRQ